MATGRPCAQTQNQLHRVLPKHLHLEMTQPVTSTDRVVTGSGGKAVLKQRLNGDPLPIQKVIGNVFQQWSKIGLFKKSGSLSTISMLLPNGSTSNCMCLLDEDEVNRRDVLGSRCRDWS